MFFREIFQDCSADIYLMKFLGEGFGWLQPGFTERSVRLSLDVVLHLDKEGIDMDYCWRLAEVLPSLALRCHSPTSLSAVASRITN